MSRIGKKSISIPQGVEVQIKERQVFVKGPKGEISFNFRPEIKVSIEEAGLVVSPAVETRQTNAFWGLTRAILANMVKGVVDGFEKKLEIQGIGFKASLEGENLLLNVGFSNPVKLEIPKSLKVLIDKNIITISGFDKELVGKFAASIRKSKPPEPYKGKGIRYLGEHVRRKEGKKVVASK